MKLSTDDPDDWADVSAAGDCEEVSQPALESRGYQIEMFEHSMRGNIVATMETGSGKTQVARLRIEAELARTPSKLIWFTTPSVVLAQQQHTFLSSQLSSYSFRLITGLDNVNFWSSKDVWDAALANQHGVISTPQVLLDALQHAFFSLRDISLLVFDEAHHCVKDHPTNLIMKSFYHPLRMENDGNLPHILGLTASPMLRSQTKAIVDLEQSLCALCRSPMVNLEEYREFVHFPRLEALPYSITNTGDRSKLLPILASMLLDYAIPKDPTFLRLRHDESLEGIQKFEKILSKQTTPVLDELKALHRQAVHLHECLGSWAADEYIRACVTKFDSMITREHEWLFTVAEEENQYLHAVLASVRSAVLAIPPEKPSVSGMTDKAQVLADYLSRELRSDASGSCIVFVKQRATAWALKELLSSFCDSKSFFHFVGMSNPLRRKLADLTDNNAQLEAFAQFRRGTLRVCIATQVMEEGVDVQACNLVVCFDDPDNVKSFIQRRGRARSSDSRFVIFQASAGSLTKYDEWKAIEEEMKSKYAEQDRQLKELQEGEEINETDDREYKVASTGAVLTIANARSHLQHFCATLPKRDGRPPPTPIFLVNGIPGTQVSCRVVLPSSLPPSLQSAESRSSWRTEKMAKRDAAFEAYVSLHKHGLLTDNLLPAASEKPDTVSGIEGRDGLYEVQTQANPWLSIRQSLPSAESLSAHRITISGDNQVFASLLLLLPYGLGQSPDLFLHASATSKLQVSVDHIPEIYHINTDVATTVTKFLFGAVLARRLPGLQRENYILPYYVVPDISATELVGWLEGSRRCCPVMSFNFEDSMEHDFVIQLHGNPVPCFLDTADAQNSFAEGDNIQVTKLSKQIDFLITTSRPALPQRLVPVEDCSISLLSSAYVRSMAFVPSILHVVEIALRAQAACNGVLKPIHYSDQSLVATALTAPGAGQRDYQRLEYIGDSLLKLFTSTNVFCGNLHMPESQLSLARDRIISNGRLQRATRDLGVEAYLTSHPFSGREWTLAQKAEANPRKLGSKTLADVVEALVGAAHADTTDARAGTAKVIKCLELFLPEIKWQSPESAVQNVKPPELPTDIGLDRVSAVESLISYNFHHRSLLLEAITHSTIHLGIQSYERLEFLGDAVVDFIVKEKLWQSALEMKEGEMTMRQSSLVNKDVFAYLTTRLVHDIATNDVQVDLRTKSTEVKTNKRRVCLHDYVRRTPDREAVKQREEFLNRYENVKEVLGEHVLKGNVFPWSALYHLSSPKWCSDVLESIVGAVFVDSGASLDVCETLLKKMGLMELVDRAATERDVVYMQPLPRLRRIYPHLGVDNRRRREEDEVKHDCRLTLHGEEVGRYVGASCKAEAQSRAAEVMLARIESGELRAERKKVREEVEAEEVEAEEDEQDAGLTRDVADGDASNVTGVQVCLKRKRGGLEDGVVMQD